MLDMIAYFENKTDVASLDLVAGAADTVHSVSGDNITVPDLGTGIVEIVGAWATLDNASDTPVNAQLSTPNMKRTLGVNLDLPLLNNPASATFAHNVPIPYNDYLARHAVVNGGSPVRLLPGEFMTAYMQGSGTSGTCYQTVAVILGDGNYVLPPEAMGKPIRVTRFTSATQPSADAWKALVLTHSQTYEAGKYALVGMRIQQDTCRFGRVILQSSQSLRGGVIGVNNVKTPDPSPYFRAGGFGSLGTFTHTNLPQIEIFSQTTDTAANGKYTLDTIQIE